MEGGSSIRRPRTWLRHGLSRFPQSKVNGAEGVGVVVAGRGEQGDYLHVPGYVGLTGEQVGDDEVFEARDLGFERAETDGVEDQALEGLLFQCPFGLVVAAE